MLRHIPQRKENTGIVKESHFTGTVQLEVCVILCRLFKSLRTEDRT